MCALCALLLYIGHFFLHSDHLSGFLCLLWAVLCPCGISGSIWGCLGLSLVRPGVFQRCSSTGLHGASPMLSPEKLSLVGGGAISPTVFPQPTARAAV